MLLLSCSKENDILITEDFGYRYAGLDVGSYVVYDVDSFYYEAFDESIDTFRFQIKEVIDSEFTDLEGETAHKIIRYKKENDTSDWFILNVWNSKLTRSNFQKVEENRRFVKLVFPLKEDNTWNGNSMNHLEEEKYELSYIDEPETIGGHILDSVLRVLQLEQINLVQEKLFEEKYAKGIGLVYKKSIDIENAPDTIPGTNIAIWKRNLGFDVEMTLSSYGN